MPLPRDRGAWQGPEMSFPLISFRCAAGGASRKLVASICDWASDSARAATVDVLPRGCRDGFSVWFRGARWQQYNEDTAQKKWQELISLTDQLTSRGN